MIATDILREEHHVISKVLDCLVLIADEGARESRLDAEAAGSALDFIREFVDGAHHAKEEERLFIALERSGLPRDHGPIAVMLAEHEEGRECVRSMSRALEQATAGDGPAIERFAEAAHTFVALLRAHIDKENSVLFPMAGQVLGSEASDALLADFRTFEAEAGGDRHRRYFSLAQRLCDRYGVAFAGPSEVPTLARELL